MRVLLRVGLAVGMALLLIAGLPTATPAAPAPSTAPLVLGAENTISANESATIEVEVPHLATYRTDLSGPSPDLSVDGRGRMVGFVLQSDTAKVPDDALRVLRINGCGESNCLPDEPFAYVDIPRDARQTDSDREVLLEPGRYTLSMLADGGPVTARIRLRGLSGQRVATASGPARSSFVVAQESNALPQSSTPSYWSGGGDLPVSRANSLVVGLFQSEIRPGVTIGSHSVCHFTGGQKPLDGRYLPGCPAEGGGAAAGPRAFAVGSIVIGGGVADLRPYRYQIFTDLSGSPGPQSAGFNVTNAAVVAPPLVYFAILQLG